jgi:hypothetical protein
LERRWRGGGEEEEVVEGEEAGSCWRSEGWHQLK